MGVLHRGLLDHDDLHSIAQELDGQRQTSRPRADDQHSSRRPFLLVRHSLCFLAAFVKLLSLSLAYQTQVTNVDAHVVQEREMVDQVSYGILSH